MGKLQSKHACTRRENPEGGAFKQAVDCIGEVDRNGDKQDLCGKDLKEDHLSHHYCALEEYVEFKHTIYEVVEVSVKQLVLSNGTTLRVKLSIAPLTRGNRKDRDIKTLRDEQDQMKDNIRCAEGQTSHIGGQNSCNMGVPERKHYSVDENTERRYHYLDQAGIENYSSPFEAEPSSEDVPYRGHQRRSHIENHSSVESSGRSVSFLRSLRSRSKSIGGSGGTAKLHGYHPVTWCQPSQQQPQQHSSSKRIRTRARDITERSRANQGLHRELQPGQAVPPGGFKYVPQRYEHYHHHEHHHHHYHHYHPT